jgi:NAD+ kinase
MELEEKLVSNGYELSNKDDYNLGISIGGDGKFLSMIHESKFDGTKKFAAINTGNLGYMTTINKDEINSFIQDLNTNNFNVEKIKYLTVKINSNDEYDGKVVKALNEISLRSTLLKTLYLSTFINNNLLYKLSGDGINVCSSCGSTAYNMSLGGSIIDPSLGAIEIAPIAPINSNIHKNITNSFITSDKNKIIIKPINKDNSISLIIDGKVLPIKDLISIEVVADSSISVLKSVEDNNIIKLNNKIYK